MDPAAESSRSPWKPGERARRRDQLSGSMLPQQPPVTFDPVVDAGASHRIPGDGLQRCHDADVEFLLQCVDGIDDAPMRTGKIERVDLGMLLFQGASPFERAFDRDLAELLEVPATGVDTGRLQTEKVLEICLMPPVLLRCKRMYGADIARTERLVSPLLGAGAAGYADSDVVLQLLEEVVERKSAREVDRQSAKQH